MAVTQNEIALNMIQQLRLLDPAISAEIGTPERKIVDTVAQVVAERQIDLTLLGGAFDLDSKFGDDLDQFLAIFGFGRQQGAQATGFVTFSRATPATYVISIPIGTQTTASSVSTDGSTVVTTLTYSTTSFAQIPIGSSSVVVPVTCTQVGTIGNVSADTITSFGQTPVTGITLVTNEVPTTGGVDPETDSEYKVRFKNTVFRNLAGTQDQFLALATATQFTTKANVVGPISRYREYIQVPDVDDATNDPDSGLGGNGDSGKYTSALSTIPYSKYVYSTIPYFVSNGDFGVGSVFYTRDLDFVLNTTDLDRDRGDAYRGRLTPFPNTGPDVNTDSSTDFQPNLTFSNVYPGTNTEVQALRPKDIVLFEHSYMSSASRNDWDRQVLNCVDVFINGENATQADAALPRPADTTNLFNGNSSSALYAENFRRVGEPNRRPVQGNTVAALFWAPITDLPDTIVTSDATFRKGVHYWAVEDVSDIGGTVRSRDGIEWNPTVNGQTFSDPDEGPYTGPTITDSVDDAISVSGYFYDRNVIDLQASIEGNKQITTDVLAHQSVTRYFKLDATVMYTTGVSIASVNDQIRQAVQTFFAGQYFGTVIQMSDLLQVIHNVRGVDNVRWSHDLLATRNQVLECDVNGNSLLNGLTDRRVYGTPSVTEVQQLYLTGAPTGGTYKLEYQSVLTGNINWNADAAAVLSALGVASIPVVTVTGSGTPTDPFILTFSSNGARGLITIGENALTGGTNVFNLDFYLKDNELPALPDGTATGDSVAGLIIRPRAQNVWSQL